MSERRTDGRDNKTRPLMEAALNYVRRRCKFGEARDATGGWERAFQYVHARIECGQVGDSKSRNPRRPSKPTATPAVSPIILITMSGSGRHLPGSLVRTAIILSVWADVGPAGQISKREKESLFCHQTGRQAERIITHIGSSGYCCLV